MYSTVQNAVYNVDTDTSSLWTWHGSLKLFRLPTLRGAGLGIQLFGLAIDNINPSALFLP